MPRHIFLDEPIDFEQRKLGPGIVISQAMLKLKEFLQIVGQRTMEERLHFGTGSVTPRETPQRYANVHRSGRRPAVTRMSLTTFRSALIICRLACVCRKACAPIIFAAIPASRAYSRIRYRIARWSTAWTYHRAHEYPPRSHAGRTFALQIRRQRSCDRSEERQLICMPVFGRRTNMSRDCQFTS